jgi:hypothetical protein
MTYSSANCSYCLYTSNTFYLAIDYTGTLGLQFSLPFKESKYLTILFYNIWNFDLLYRPAVKYILNPFMLVTFWKKREEVHIPI